MISTPFTCPCASSTAAVLRPGTISAGSRSTSAALTCTARARWVCFIRRIWLSMDSCRSRSPTRPSSSCITLCLLAGSYLFLRRWVASPAAAVFGAIAFTFFGYSTYHFMHIHWITIICPPALEPVAGRPAVPRAAGPAPRALGGLRTGALTGSELLLGISAHGLAREARRGLLRALPDGRRAELRPLLVYTWYTALGVLLGAVAVGPDVGGDEPLLARRAVACQRSCTDRCTR